MLVQWFDGFGNSRKTSEIYGFFPLHISVTQLELDFILQIPESTDSKSSENLKLVAKYEF